MKWIYKVSTFVLAICFIHNQLFRMGFFGGSTYGKYENQYVRIFKVRDQKALIAPNYENKWIVYTKTKETKWIELYKIDFDY